MDIESPTPDPLDIEIAKVEAAIAGLGREIDKLRIQRDALKLAASLRPVLVGSILPGGASRPTISKLLALKGSTTRGKAPGAINNSWRLTLSRVVEEGNNFLSPDLWAAAAKEVGVELQPKAARDWLYRGGGAKRGYVERRGDTYRVSDLAIEKFGLKAPKPPSEDTDDDFL